MLILFLLFLSLYLIPAILSFFLAAIVYRLDKTKNFIEKNEVIACLLPLINFGLLLFSIFSIVYIIGEYIAKLNNNWIQRKWKSVVDYICGD